MFKVTHYPTITGTSHSRLGIRLINDDVSDRPTLAEWKRICSLNTAEALYPYTYAVDDEPSDDEYGDY